MRTKEEIMKDMEILKAELVSITPKKFAPGTLVHFRDWQVPDDSPMNLIGKVVRHGRKWIEIKVEGKKGVSYAKTEPIGAVTQETKEEVSTAQNAKEPQQQGKHKEMKRKKHEVVEMRHSA